MPSRASAGVPRKPVTPNTTPEQVGRGSDGTSVAGAWPGHSLVRPGASAWSLRLAGIPSRCPAAARRKISHPVPAASPSAAPGPERPGSASAPRPAAATSAGWRTSAAPHRWTERVMPRSVEHATVHRARSQPSVHPPAPIDRRIGRMRANRTQSRLFPKRFCGFRKKSAPDGKRARTALPSRHRRPVTRLRLRAPVRPSTRPPRPVGMSVANAGHLLGDFSRPRHAGQDAAAGS